MLRAAAKAAAGAWTGAAPWPPGAALRAAPAACRPARARWRSACIPFGLPEGPRRHARSGALPDHDAPPALGGRCPCLPPRWPRRPSAPRAAASLPSPRQAAYCTPRCSRTHAATTVQSRRFVGQKIKKQITRTPVRRRESCRGKPVSGEAPEAPSRRRRGARAAMPYPAPGPACERASVPAPRP